MRVVDMSKRGITLVLTFIIILGSFSFVAASSFSDISDTYWVKGEIEYLAEKNLVQGVGNGTYIPNDNVTRAQFVTMINKALGLSDEIETGNIEFTDVHHGAWYYEDVVKAATNGYVTGYDNGTFKPDAPISREQAATMISKAFGLSEAAEKAGFLDTNRISNWARDFVNVVSEKGYLVGFPDGNFKPDLNITRAQSAAIVYRVLTGDVAEVPPIPEAPPEPPAPVAPVVSKGDQVISEARKYLGYRYVSGGASPSGFDCSGFTSYVYDKFGASLPRTTTGQATVGSQVSKANLQPGDLLVFSNTYKSGISHVGIYIGNGRFIHSANPRVGVEENTISSGYWSNHFTYGKRVF